MQRLKKIFVRAGGVQRATDLVEYYEAVGYAHFLLYSIPSTTGTGYSTTGIT